MPTQELTSKASDQTAMNSEIRFHPTNAGADTKPIIGKLEGGEVLVMAASIAGSILFFRFLAGHCECGLPASLIAAALVPLTTLAFLMRFVSGQPPSHVADCAAWAVYKFVHWMGRAGLLAWTPRLLSLSHDHKDQ